MKKLEKRIEERAKARLEEEFVKFTSTIDKTDIGRMLKVWDGEEQKSFVNAHGTTNSTFFNCRFATEIGKEMTNIEEVKAKLLEKYIEEETSLLLDKIGVLTEYLG